MKLLITGAWQVSSEQLNKIESMGHSVIFMQNEKDKLPCEYCEVEGVVCNGLFLYHQIEKFVNLKYIQEVKIEKTHSNGVSSASGLVVNLVINEEIKTFNTISIYSGDSKNKETLIDNVIGETVIAGLDEKNQVAVIIKKL